MNRLIQGSFLAFQLVALLWLGISFTWWLGIAIFGGFLFLLIGLQFYLSRKVWSKTEGESSLDTKGESSPDTEGETSLDTEGELSAPVAVNAAPQG